MSSFSLFFSSCFAVFVVVFTKCQVTQYTYIRYEIIGREGEEKMKLILLTKPCFAHHTHSFAESERGHKQNQHNMNNDYRHAPPPPSTTGLAFTCISLLASVTSPSHLNRHASIASSIAPDNKYIARTPPSPPPSPSPQNHRKEKKRSSNLI